MTDHLCVICARREPSERHTVCAPCLGRLDDDLARLVELTALAASWLTPRATTGAGVRSVPGSRPPLSVDALDLALGLGGGIVDPDPLNGSVDPRPAILETLEGWERMTRDHYSLGAYGPASAARNAALSVEQYRSHVDGPPVTVKGCAGFLRAWLLRIAEDGTYPIDDLAREVRTLRLDAEHVDPDHERPDGLRVACTEPHPDADGRECGYRLVIVGAMLSQDVECRRCGHVTTGGRMILSALSDPAVTVWAYPDVIEDTLGVKGGTLRQWVRRGHIKRSGSRYDAGAVYRRKHDVVSGVAES